MCSDLLARFAEVSDGRGDQGRVHPVAVVLALCAAAVVAGMGSFTAIAGWAADVPAGLLAQLYGRPAAPPSKATIWRVVTGADAAAVDAVIGVWLAGQAAERESTGYPAEGERAGLVAIAVDGKTVRRYRHRGQPGASARRRDPPRCPGVGPGRGRREDQRDPDVCTPARRARRRRCRPEPSGDHRRRPPHPMRPRRVLARARRGIRVHRHGEPARALRRARRAALVGGTTTRTIQVLPAPPDLPFPHVNQAWLIERYTRDPTGTPLSAVAALRITNLPAHPGTPECLATLNRQHWGIESLHWLRDTLYREDHSTVHTRSGPHVMAALRNLVIGAIRLTGRRDITEATRDMHRPFKILKLTP